ncbi:hypothetical protein SAMN05216420_10452 [Nitrosospira sp. Nl5]|uniref:hypothetical protein n=1 Tax=Nitrosospira sp. Nl5 TaxID=200120 RepID=UPI0008847ABA|nr:hypothetical protein [Nitrosospira sp. Nl5]SCY26816.1 hypothetical protein SAMN05216420_10452 [Nitrosospira sp. Nl5]
MKAAVGSGLAGGVSPASMQSVPLADAATRRGRRSYGMRFLPAGEWTGGRSKGIQQSVVLSER